MMESTFADRATEGLEQPVADMRILDFFGNVAVIRSLPKVLVML